MILIKSNYITKNNCLEFINYYKNNTIKIDAVLDVDVYRYNGIDIINELDKFNFFKEKNINKKNIDRIRIQHIDNTISMIKKSHTHKTPFSFVIFLNDNFTGGELIFNNININASVGQMVYFDGFEPHYVEDVLVGDRYTLVCFLKNEINIQKEFI
jgi:hypothetical protein